GRIEAILSLGYAQAEAALGTLKKSINNKDKDIAYFSIIALGQIHIVASAKILLGFLKKRKIYHYKVFSVLETFPAQIAEEVIKLTDDTDPQVRAWAIKLISRFRAHSYIKKIEEMVFDKSEDVRASACDCLGEFGSKDAKDTLTKALNDDFWLVRVHAVKALAKVLGKECLPEVIGQINDASLSVIDSLKNVVAEYIEAALPYVEKFLYSNDEIARRVSVEALEASGYIIKVFKDILTGSEEEEKRAKRLLEGLILSRAHFGLEGAMVGFTKEKRDKLLGVIRVINKEMADYLEKGITTGRDGE
ncbi:MAG: HEAT repeat domain-containing protein, partial [Candidatus Omnitrophica bacterium]|nr:HEAT repeat domain-containing protein [Candidatus Omnitrophota bacterium]